MNQQILQLTSKFNLLEIGISPDVLLFDKDVGNGALTCLFGKVGLDVVSVIYVQTVSWMICSKGDVPI